jgi:hypothetical protein
LDARYVSACEAIWRLLEFKLHDRYPVVVRLPVHLPEQNIVYYDPQNAGQGLERGKNTELTMYFDQVRKELELAQVKPPEYDPPAFELLYHEFPKFYVFTKDRKWKRRDNGKKEPTVGRIFSAHPSDTERFCLRLLLTNVRGVDSFEYLRTFDDVIYPTFKQACLARGLLPSDSELCKVMDEAISFRTPNQLRILFATLLIFVTPACPLEFYELYKNHLNEDFTYRLLLSEEPLDFDPEELALLEINEELIQHGKSLDFFELPLPSIDYESSVPIQESFDDSSLEDIDSEISALNSDQRSVLNEIQSRIRSEQGGLLFLDAPGGTGKTYTFNLCLKWMEVEYGKDSYLSMASSGVASLLLRAGRTAHSTFKVPLNITCTSSCEINGKSKYADAIRMAKLIVWDEVRAQFTFSTIILIS